MDRDALILASDDELLRLCEVDRYRASGPGGQHRNKTESAVRVRHVATGVAAHADDSRSQHENRARAVKRLRGALALELRRPVALDGFVADARLAALVAGGTAPLGEKTRQTAGYWVAIARLLDVFVAAGAEVAATAERLGIGTAALARLLTHDPLVHRAANQYRGQRGLRPLR
ncbi:MAG: hypothetical protein KJZ91_06900 [Myxococcales bacterium]|nr:hypothetical protein [Myxococcales bacterium]